MVREQDKAANNCTFIFMNEQEAIKKLEEQFGIISPSAVYHEKLKSLAARINDLLNHDFQKLISILYRMDISESKLRRLLEENKTMDAGLIIANLMIEREVQKIQSRKESAQKNNEIKDDESW